MNTRQKGAVGVAKAIAYFADKGYVVLIPVSEAQRYDLVIEKNGDLQRVEVKSSSHKTGRSKSYRVHLKTCGGRQKTTFLSKEDCDLVFMSIADGSQYLFPVEDLTERDSIYLSVKYDSYKV